MTLVRGTCSHDPLPLPSATVDIVAYSIHVARREHNSAAPNIEYIGWPQAYGRAVHSYARSARLHCVAVDGEGLWDRELGLDHQRQSQSAWPWAPG